MANSDTVYLLDASIYIFRAWFGYPDSIVDQHGRPVNAVYGYWRQLLQGIEQRTPRYLLAAFDESLFSGFRHQLYPDYKANRALPDAALAHQLDACRRLTDALGVTTRSSQVYEADDVLATAANVARTAGFAVDVVSRDKDLAQIVTPGDAWSDWASGISHGHAALHEQWGVPPAAIPDLLALTGDAVDNIPGVPKVGKKSATVLLQHFGDLENLFSRLDEVLSLPLRGARTLADQLAAHQQEALLYRELIRLHQADCAIEADDLQRREVDADQVLAVLQDLDLGNAFVREWERYRL
ncbi:MAG: 5'-3' exonuclease H3TH domain-containing protein [Gammaproteobacteria bacterium]